MSDMNVWPHYCETDHEPIGHAGDDERCPLCKMRDERDAARTALAEAQAERHADQVCISNLRNEVAEARAALAEAKRVMQEMRDSVTIIRERDEARAVLAQTQDVLRELVESCLRGPR